MIYLSSFGVCTGVCIVCCNIYISMLFSCTSLYAQRNDWIVFCQVFETCVFKSLDGNVNISDSTNIIIKEHK